MKKKESGSRKTCLRAFDLYSRILFYSDKDSDITFYNFRLLFKKKI